MTLQEALDNRIPKVRLPNWSEEAYVAFDFFEDGTHGPWAHVIDASGQIDVMLFEFVLDQSDEWEEYTEGDSIPSF